ncbi:adenine deaminase [bacterium (Candidatus Blackallbacteria) CG17_big_fil_post_rev_8_21_14_2_50_48_46]|uniref:Adenine deaminase n=1 Tax=bacterium (Candidatus Blackallbacteria) CG17_big_fil_post_rev_8_21_14_2_50_48_46 TaxID=2014261 RepID=A0A2M7G5W2_9BACT|nr:MAG: adenine deaminase [bacterium (Candidatus Blackallbacteria) CG18_big_fil_WC_8_21_14_2_50_49_26]PIW16972.1 MAG: adenine deaminase [bacterium (Candidatus Blackallbacteria) CG17_big_fil_post_rev_8_21_14_2_50_48_46]PIW50251.1 MAG: adenine deaminase [bacterium (Candidatus Blackallbacteria) CG13_big_fil_rev_8_21_14_2_50_49_14]
MHEISGQWVDLLQRRIVPAKLTLAESRILKIEELVQAPEVYLIPGLIDAHIHLESSMLVPAEFARMAMLHGTVGSVSDPHEIANVLGLAGVEFMLQNSHTLPFHFCFGAPSCVPATVFETAGARLGLEETRQLLENPEIHYLSEMMNIPGVLQNDPEVMGKIALAQSLGKPIDGHAPGLRGADLETYLKAGISTDHEAFSLEEAREKARKGMKILIREGSAARNFEALIPLLAETPELCMFCSDDRHPDDLLKGHINQMVAKALAAGYDLFDTLRAASLNPIQHYGLKAGLLQVGDSADFIEVSDLQRFKIQATWIQGQKCVENGKSLLNWQPSERPNRFVARPVQPSDFKVPEQQGQIHVIHALDGELITEDCLRTPTLAFHETVADPSRDLLKIAVLNRYQPHAPVVDFIENFGLKQGAIASSVAHDSHNLIAVGCSNQDLSRAMNRVIEMKGGICAVYAGKERVLPLPIAGLMSDRPGPEVAEAYAALNRMIREEMGSPLRAPLMTLSFMALLVIPALKISDQGLFDGVHFRFAHLYAEAK